MPYCKRCKNTKPDADFTRKDKVWKQCNYCYAICAPSRGRNAIAKKEERKVYLKEWRKKNPDKVKAHNVRLYAENQDKYLAQKRDYFKRNRDGVLARQKKWREDNPEKQKEMRKRMWAKQKNDPRYIEKRKAWRKANREHLRKDWQNRYDTDPAFRIAQNTRCRVRDVLKGKNKSDNTMELVGCSIQELKDYLEDQFVDGMSWDNYGKWEIDHIATCKFLQVSASFDLSKPEEQRACFSWVNLQPLWKDDNRAKSDRLDWVPNS